MYIKSANIFGFGKLVDKKFDFQQDYQVIRGFNESGKTTLLAFIKAILFGFESAKSTDEQYIPKNANQYGGELVLVEDNSEWLIRRVKVKKVIGDVTIYKDNVEFPESALTDLLKKVDKDMYNSAYILNQKNLGNFDKLERDELIDNILTVGAVGGTEWLDLVKQLDNDAGEVYRTSKNAKKPLNLALRDYNDLVKEQSAIQDQKAEFADKTTELENAVADGKKSTEQHDLLLAELNKQRSVLNKKAEYQEYLQLASSTNSETQIISNDDWDKFKALDEQSKALNNNLNNSQNTLVALTDNEELILNNYHSNQLAIDKIRLNLDEISRKEFNLEQLQSEMTTAQMEKQRLLTNNNKLTENMSPLTVDELTEVNKAIKQIATNKIPINLYLGIGASVVTAGSFFLPGMLKTIVVFGLVAMAWFFYQASRDAKTVTENAATEYLAIHNYRDLTLEEASMWQSQITQLQNSIHKFEQASADYADIKRELDGWKKSVSDLNIVSEENVKNVNAYFEQLSYLQKKQADIQATDEQIKIKNSEISQQLLALNQQQTDLIAKYHLGTAADFIKKRDKDLQAQEQINRLAVLEESLDADILARISSDPTELEKISADLSAKQVQLADIEQVAKEKNNQVAQLQVTIDNLADDTDYLRLEKAINDKKTEIIEYYDDWVAQKLGSAWVYDTLNLASSNRFPKMMERTQKYFEILTTGKYVGVSFEETTIEVQSANSQKFELHELSTGTIAQLFIALRCAFVMEISDLVKLPILIDDAFNDFDKNRYEAAANLVKSMSEENQIFYVMNNNIPADYFDMSHIIDLGGKDDK